MLHKILTIALAISVLAIVAVAFAYRLTWSDEKAFMFDCHNEGRSHLECEISWKAQGEVGRNVTYARNTGR